MRPFRRKGPIFIARLGVWSYLAAVSTPDCSARMAALSVFFPGEVRQLAAEVAVRAVSW